MICLLAFFLFDFVTSLNTILSRSLIFLDISWSPSPQVVFETGSSVAKMSLELTMGLWVTLNSSCRHLPAHHLFNFNSF